MGIKSHYQLMSQPERILLWGSNLWMFADGMLGPLFAVLSQRIGGNVLDISWAWAVYIGVTGIFVIIVGAVSDRLSKEKLLVAGYALTAVFTFCYLLVTKPIHLLLVQAGLGLSLGLSNPTWFALYDKHTHPDRKGFAWGLEDGMAKIITALAILIGGAIVRYGSFKALFIIMGTLQTLAALYQAQLLRKNLKGHAQKS
jgi:MFS family permease